LNHSSGLSTSQNISQRKKSHAPGSIFTVTECPIRSQTKIDNLGIVVVTKKQQLPAPIAKAGLKSFLLEVVIDGDLIVFSSLAKTFFPPGGEKPDETFLAIRPHHWRKHERNYQSPVVDKSLDGHPRRSLISRERIICEGRLSGGYMFLDPRMQVITILVLISGRRGVGSSGWRRQ